LNERGGGTLIPRILTNLFVNYDASSSVCGGMATAPTTWGAIKNLYRGD
jgi:hypothetical protein